MNDQHGSPQGPWPRPWRVERWQRHHYDRVYVRSSDGIPVGWFDLLSGDVHAVDPTQQADLIEFLEDWRQGADATAMGEVPRPRASDHQQERADARGNDTRLRQQHQAARDASEASLPSRTHRNGAFTMRLLGWLNGSTRRQ